MFKAQIEFRATEDSYEHGEIGDVVNSWNETITAATQSDLRDKVLRATYSEWKYIDDDQMNEYEWCTEYHTSYLANEDNQGDASKSEIASWEKGETRLFAVNCHILVTEVIEKKATL